MTSFAKYSGLSRFLPVLLIGLLVVLLQCTPEARYGVLTFMFDGVPEQNFNEQEHDSIIETDTNLLLAQVKVEELFFMHSPYEERSCDNCHTPGSMGNLLIPQPDLCYTCHESFSDMYTSLHGPVLGGYCTECHNPHKSEYKSLLKRKDSEVCTKCHEERIVMKNPIHKKAGERNCVECHNPHGGDNRSYSRQGVCYICHDNFKDKYKNLHGPVAAEYCTMCHGPHSLSSKAKLIRTGQDLCYYCHQKELILNNDIHKEIGSFECTECHNPHGSATYFLLR